MSANDAKRTCDAEALFHRHCQNGSFCTGHFAMPRYYFHLSDGTKVLNNHKGIDLSGNAAAREDALVLARDLKHGAVMPGWDWSGWFVTIVDAHGHKVDEVSIADV